MRDCVIFDVDGTLANNKHRSHHLEKSPKDWDSFFAVQHLDEPVAPIRSLLNTLSIDYPIILCTGRMEKFRAVTTGWLSRHGIGYKMMFMRQTDDFRHDVVVKGELLDQIISMEYNPVFVVDDRNSVCKMWRERGLVCLQCAEGDF